MNTYKLILTGILFSIFIGCSSDTIKEPIVIVQTPKVEFSTSPSELRAEQEVNFSGRFLTGSTVITSWEWSFGDSAGSTSGGQNASFVYSEEGTYTVSLTARDADDASSTVTEDIVILEALADPFEAAVAWSFSNGTPVAIHNDGSSTPTIGDDGVVYYLESFAGGDSKLVAVNDLGTSATKVWDVSLGGNLRNAPSIGTDGNLYTGAWTLDAINKVNASNGNILWQGNTNSGVSNSTAAVDGDGNVYFGTRAVGIMSWNPNGSLRWAYTSASSSARYYASPALSKDGTTVYALATGGEFFAINTADGTLKWSQPLAFSGDGTGTSLSIDSDGTIYFTSTDGVFAVTDNGTEGVIKWSYSVADSVSSGIVIGSEGDLYVGSGSGLISLNASDGSERWIYDLVAIEESVPAIDSEGNIYTGTNDGRLVVLNSSGVVIRELILTNNTVHSPVIASDGTVYVEAYDGSVITLFKINVNNSEGPANSPWPMKGQNTKNTGLAI